MVTPAHDQLVTRSYVIHYPDHAPRASDPYYSDFHAYKALRRKAGTWTCDFALEHRHGDTSECDLARPLEAHHRHIEFAVMNSVDLALLEPDYPGVSEMGVGKWVESAANLMLLCVTEGSPIRMADGSARPIEDVRPGDWVTGRDGWGYPVTATRRKRYRGEVIVLGSAAFTPEHRVLGHGQWLPAAQVLREVRVHGPEVIALRGEQHQVAPGITRAVPVQVVDPLSGEQIPTDPVFHYLDVLHDHPVSVPDAEVALAGQVRSPVPRIPYRELVEAGHPAGIRAVPALHGRAEPPVEPDTTGLARAEMGWFAVMPSPALFTGWVHDLSVAHSRSFIAGGIVAHNCVFHHRGHAGVHVASSSDYEATSYIRRLIG